MRTSLLADGATREKRKRLQKLRSTLDFDALARNELELKANLFFHIGNPVKRWRVERVVPIKLLLQLLKSFCLLTQVTWGTGEWWGRREREGRGGERRRGVGEAEGMKRKNVYSPETENKRQLLGHKGLVMNA